MKLQDNTTYLVESDGDDTVLLAMDAKVRDGWVEWFDTVRDRAFQPEQLEPTPDGVRFQAHGRKYALRKLTAELYNARVAGKVTGSRSFRDTDALQSYYRQFPR